MLIEDWDGETPLGDGVEAQRVARGWEFLGLRGLSAVHACDGRLILRLPPDWSPRRAAEFGPEREGDQGDLAR